MCISPQSLPTYQIHVWHTQTLDTHILYPPCSFCLQLTGRILKTGELSGIPDIQELPEMKSPARSPTFKFRMTINKESLVADPDMIVLLRVYTVDRDSKEPKDLCVIGSCLYGFFNSNVSS